MNASGPPWTDTAEEISSPATLSVSAAVRIAAAGDAAVARRAADDGYRPNYVVAAERVIEFIATHHLHPGDRLPTEQALAAELGFGRSVVRESLKILAALGRVNASKGRGIFVADDPHLRLGSGEPAETFLPADPQHVRELLEFRRVLEGAAARRAALHATPRQLKALRDAAGSCTGAAQRDDRTAFDAADAHFHAALAECADNRFLNSVTATVRNLQQQVVVLGLQGGTGGVLVDAAADHEAIFAAISEGDPSQAEQAAYSHIDRTLDGYQAEILSHLNRIGALPTPELRAAAFG